jgi:hypothetical protein
MCNFNKQPKQTKEFLHLFMQKAAQNIGGVNFLLALIEAIKSKKPHPLIYSECKISSNNTTIRWNKTVFKDKVDLLEEILLLHKSSQEPDFNILNNENEKKRKKILNMVKTLAPIEFVVTPQNKNDGGGFSFKVFDTLEDGCAKLNPIFIAIFFCSVEFSKKSLKYEI